MRQAGCCIVLDRGEDETHVHTWLSTAAGVPGFIGFAVGRTTFWGPLIAWHEQKSSRDAAALVDPFLGEGIYYGIRSGQLAAQTNSEGLSAGESAVLSAYGEFVDAEIYRWRELRRFAVGDLLRLLWPTSSEPHDVAAYYDQIARRYDAALPL